MKGLQSSAAGDRGGGCCFKY